MYFDQHYYNLFRSAFSIPVISPPPPPSPDCKPPAHSLWAAVYGISVNTAKVTTWGKSLVLLHFLHFISWLSTLHDMDGLGIYLNKVQRTVHKLIFLPNWDMFSQEELCQDVTLWGLLLNLGFGILLRAFSYVHGFNKAETHTKMCRKNSYSVSSLYITAGFVWPCPLFSPKTGPSVFTLSEEKYEWQMPRRCLDGLWGITWRK